MDEASEMDSGVRYDCPHDPRVCWKDVACAWLLVLVLAGLGLLLDGVGLLV